MRDPVNYLMKQRNAAHSHNLEATFRDFGGIFALKKDFNVKLIIAVVVGQSHKCSDQETQKLFCIVLVKQEGDDNCHCLVPELNICRLMTVASEKMTKRLYLSL